SPTPNSFTDWPRFCVRIRPCSASSSCPLSWLCQALRAPASKLRRATVRSLPSIVTVLPVKRGSSAAAAGGCCASPTQWTPTTRATTSQRSTVRRFMLTSLHWRVVGRIAEDRFHFRDDAAVDLRLGRHLLPLLVGAEISPRLLRRLAARMLENVNQRVLGIGRILRRHVEDALHAVLVEDADGVIAEALVQFDELAFGGGVGAQLVDMLPLREGDRTLGAQRAGREPGDEKRGRRRGDHPSVDDHALLLS